MTPTTTRCGACLGTGRRVHHDPESGVCRYCDGRGRR